MKKNICGNKKYTVMIFFCLSLSICGCATVPKHTGVPSYTIDGASYLSLSALCDLKGIRYEYDALTRTVELKKLGHLICLRIGDGTVYVDGSMKKLNHPVDLYAGSIVVPNKFRQQVLDMVFKDEPVFISVKPSFFKIKKVIIDAGHGGKDPGAIGRTGLKEKEVTLDIAKMLKKLMETQGIEVMMTRSTDRFVPLSERVTMTNNSKADLFVSIHANANPVKSLNGFEVYYVSPKSSDSQRALSAAKTEELNLDRSCFASSNIELKAILWDMVNNYNKSESIILSKTICQTIGRNLDTRVIGSKGANFCVLRGSCIPAVLIEVGFLSNLNEEKLLYETEHRKRLAECIRDGIREYAKELSEFEFGRGQNFSLKN
jgi:N-acetylmuramoyl-L-alanine amidase